MTLKWIPHFHLQHRPHLLSARINTNHNSMTYPLAVCVKDMGDLEMSLKVEAVHVGDDLIGDGMRMAMWKWKVRHSWMTMTMKDHFFEIIHQVYEARLTEDQLR